MGGFYIGSEWLLGNFCHKVGAPYPVPAGPTGAKWLRYTSVLSRIERALAKGVEKWRTNAGFHGVIIDGALAHGGKLIGPPLKPLIMEEFYRFGRPALSWIADWEPPVVKAIVNPLSEAWGEFERSFSVPHLPWYPSFAACKPPDAVPTTNVPCLLKSLAHSGASLSPHPLLERMKRDFTPPPAWSPPSPDRSLPRNISLDPESRAELKASATPAQSMSQVFAELGIPAPSAPPTQHMTPAEQMAWAMSGSPLPPPPLPPPGLLNPLPDPYQYVPKLLETVAYAFSFRVAEWLGWQKVIGVMGSGPVPTATSGVRKGGVVPGPHLRRIF